MSKKEMIWILIVIAILATFSTSLVLALSYNYNVPKDYELIACPGGIPSFQKGIKEVEPGVYEVNILASKWFFDPYKIVLKNPKVIKFVITSADLTHGFLIVGTNVNAMVLPGYQTVITWHVPQDFSGEFLIICNEYCGTGHSTMYGILVIER